MGCIRGKDIKDVSFKLFEKYPDRFSEDYEQNKKSLAEMKLFDSKKQRNRVAGYIVRVAGKIKKR